MDQALIKYANKLKNLINTNRYKHSLGVMETALKLAKKYGADEKKAAIAGLLHDCAKNLTDEELLKLAVRFYIPLNDVLRHSVSLLHGPVGACLLKEYFGIDDEDIKKAVALHTTGDINMSLLDKIIFLADYIEPGRNFDGVEVLRKAAEEDINKAVIMALNNTIISVVKRNMLLYEKTVQARNEMIIKFGDGI
ncbi:MAG: bis(5'-nucleosyl)-tetraphosphatase (symmetrical) YqeK [Thermoanaerobacteraceae bacterium]|nr:bis(5'-nucleosyl)-tetraphosphatase (symmetrical) YqeK [Thermoanaerobacteraceae bacterium]